MSGKILSSIVAKHMEADESIVADSDLMDNEVDATSPVILKAIEYGFTPSGNDDEDIKNAVVFLEEMGEDPGLTEDELSLYGLGTETEFVDDLEFEPNLPGLETKPVSETFSRDELDEMSDEELREEGYTRDVEVDDDGQPTGIINYYKSRM